MGDQQSAALVARPENAALLSAGEIKARVQLVHDVMRTVMKKDVHYGVIPGTQRPSLWKAGAEKLAMTFRIAVELVTLEERVTEEEVFYRVRAIGRSQDGQIVGTAEGTCSTSEKKYRWREPVHPKEFAAFPDNRKRFTWNKKGDEIRQVRQDPGDLVNTILQMASKRASVQMIRGVTGATDIFAADPDDDRSEDADRPPAAPPARPATSAAGAPASAAAPVDLRVVGVRTVTNGERNGEAWTLFGVKFSNDREATTFSDSLKTIAEKLMADGAACIAHIEPGEKPGRYRLEALERA